LPSTVTRGTAPVVVVLGLLCLGGAVALAWLGSLGTLHLTRNATTVNAVYEERIVGLFPISGDRIDSIVAVESVPTRTSTRSNSPNQMVFLTTSGPVNRGLSQQRFARSYVNIDTFIKDPSRSDLVVSTTYDFWETLRFWAGQLGMLFLAAVGVFTLILGIKALLPEDPRAGIGPA